MKTRVPRDARLPFVGRYGGDGQFVCTVVTAAERDGRAWFAVLHTFDGEGRHRGTEVFRAGPESDPASARRAAEQQQQWLRRLATMLLGAIEVEPFEHVAHGVRFGVVVDGGACRLEPDGVPLGA